MEAHVLFKVFWIEKCGELCPEYNTPLSFVFEIESFLNLCKSGSSVHILFNGVLYHVHDLFSEAFGHFEVDDLQYFGWHVVFGENE